MENNNQVKGFFLLIRSLSTGFINGLLWSTIWIIMYYFNFTEITPKAYLLRPWKSITWTNGWIGDIVSIIIIAVLSIIVASIYYMLFKRLSSIWIGVIYGCLIWIILFMAIHPIIPYTKQLSSFSKETIVTTLSLFILYGTFIGYSISFDYYDTFKHGQAKDVT